MTNNLWSSSLSLDWSEQITVKVWTQLMFQIFRVSYFSLKRTSGYSHFSVVWTVLPFYTNKKNSTISLCVKIINKWTYLLNLTWNFFKRKIINSSALRNRHFRCPTEDLFSFSLRNYFSLDLQNTLIMVTKIRVIEDFNHVLT